MEQQTIAKTGIRKLKLTNFRCYAFCELSINSNLPVVLTGANGAGKTNLLEAVSFLVPGRGLRNARFADIARHTTDYFGSDDGDCTYSNVTRMPVGWGVWAKVISSNAEVELGTGCEPTFSEEGLALSRRIVKIDGTISSQNDLSSVLSAVWITPAMDRLFSGEVAPRRRFLDRIVQTFDVNHATRLNAYANAYKEWGKLLREGCRDRIWLQTLEKSMAENGVAIAAARVSVLARLAPYLAKSESGFPTARVALSGFLEENIINKPALTVEDLFREKLCMSRNFFADGGSVVGVHQTDFVVHYENGIEASLCSTGQQKALLVALVIANAKAIAAAKTSSPLFLFDEVSAHLDKKRREALFEILLALNGQVWFTGTDSADFSYLNGKAQFFNVENAEIYANVA